MTEQTELELSLGELVSEALGVRFAGGADGYAGTMSPADILRALRELRQRLDRLESILGRVVRLKAHLARRKAVADADVDDAWSREVVYSRSRTRPGGDMVGPRERYAEADLAVLSQRRAARHVGRDLSLAEEAVEVVRLSHRGLDGVRQDLLASLRALQVESSLER